MTYGDILKNRRHPLTLYRLSPYATRCAHGAPKKSGIVAAELMADLS
jgi:hypothetical protein